MKNDEFGDRMKTYERRYTAARVTPDQFLCVRIDGKNFSKFTSKFEKPFDTIMTNSMQKTTRFLVEQTHANIGYTQSDEITLIYSAGEKAKEHIFGGKTSKINSILASMATACFNRVIEDHQCKFAFFDCRSWAVPSEIEASNVLLWRVQDARKNSISSMFHAHYGHKAMHGLSGIQMKERLEEDGNSWNDLPDVWKYGTYYKKIRYRAKLTDSELANIPEGCRPVEGLVERNYVAPVDYKYFGDIDLEDRILAISR